MIVDLAVPFVDAGIADLRFVTGGLDVGVLDDLAIPDWLPGAELSLRLLGASHQAVLTTPAGQYIETLACLGDDTGEPPPGRHTEQVGDWRIEFTCRFEQLRPEVFERNVTRLRETAVGDRRVLLGQFPGLPNAVTLLDGSFATPQWRTVHAYPESGTWVSTTTTVQAGSRLATN